MMGVKKPVRKAHGTRINWVSKPAPGNLPPKKHTLRAVYVNDILNAVGKPSKIEPARYRDAPFVSDEVSTALSSVSSAFVVSCDFYLGDKGTYPFPTLEPYNGPIDGELMVRKGTMIVYAGSVRCTERKWFNADHRYIHVTVAKHTFITPWGRYIIHNVDCLQPIS